MHMLSGEAGNEEPTDRDTDRLPTSNGMEQGEQDKGGIEQNRFRLCLNKPNRPRQVILPVKPSDFTAQCKRARAASIMLSFPWRASVLSRAQWVSGAMPASICCMFTS